MFINRATWATAAVWNHNRITSRITRI
jgi:hypothetical protein